MLVVDQRKEREKEERFLNICVFHTIILSAIVSEEKGWSHYFSLKEGFIRVKQLDIK